MLPYPDNEIAEYRGLSFVLVQKDVTIRKTVAMGTSGERGIGQNS